MNKKTAGIISAALTLAPLFVFILSPIEGFASHNDAHRADGLRAEIQSYKNEIARLGSTLKDGAKVRATKLLEDEIKTAESKLAVLEARIKGAAVGLMLDRNLSKGSSGNDVKQVQELLAKFPDIYPEGLATGYFGQLTEKAVKALQKGLGLEQVGNVGPKTREKLGQISTEIGRKEKPRIAGVSPNSISVSAVVTLTGSGFTFENNYLFVRGRMVLKNLSSADGSSLEFAVPRDIPCAVETACPIKIANKNGISNAKPFKLVPPAQQPEPEPIPPPPPPPPPTPQITGISPSYGQVGAAVTLTGTGFTATNNSINFGGLSNAVTGLASSNGLTLTFTVPSSSCQPLVGCSVSVVNAGGISNVVTFTLTQPVTPVVVTAPNGGERFVQSLNSLIKWTGGTDAVHIALVEDTAVKGGDPTPLIIGWITTTALPGGSFSWNAEQVCDVTMTVCSPVSPGNYKILVVSENELGQVSIGFDGNGNWDASDASFSILPAPKITVISPNGGEKWIIGQTVTVTWEMVNVQKKRLSISLHDNSIPPDKDSTVAAITQDLSVSADSGIFTYSWVVPSWISPGSNYAVWVQEYDFVWGQARDWSDATFTIATNSTIAVTSPNGGETWFAGFKGLIRWNSGNILSKTVNINLFKAGKFYRSLASNVLQKFYSWQTSGYTSGTGFNTYVNIPADIPDGSDYAIEIVDAADSTTRDVSDIAFTIQAVPNSMTFSGRLINRFLLSALAYTRLYLDGGRNYSTTGANGEFAVSTSTASLFDSTIYGIKIAMPVGSWPNCFMNWRYDIFTTETHPYWRDHVFDLLPDKTGVFTQANTNLGDVPMWPGTGLYFYSDNKNLTSAGVSYPDSGYWGWQILALEADLKVNVYDTTTGTYAYSPSIRIPLANACTPKSLTYVGGVFKWEPYNVRSNYYLPSTMKVGQLVSTTFSASGGVAPYTWGFYYGSLPPGLMLDPSTGKVGGTVTTAGTYKFQLRTTDSAGVNGGSWPMTITVSP